MKYFQWKQHGISDLPYDISSGEMDEARLTDRCLLRSWMMDVMSLLYNPLYFYICLYISISLLPSSYFDEDSATGAEG